MLLVIKVIVGKRIKELRLEKGMSQEALALSAGMDRTYIAGIESGRRNPTLLSLEKLLSAMGISFGDFFKNM